MTSPGGESTTAYASLGNVLTYTDPAATAAQGRTYYYTVAAMNVVGVGPWSTEVNNVSYALSTAPQTLSTTAGNNQITLNWTVPSWNGNSPITTYNLYRGTTSGSEVLIGAMGNMTGYIDSGQINEQAYYYKITAVTVAGESPKTAEVTATPDYILQLNVTYGNGTLVNNAVVSMQLLTNPTAIQSGNTTTFGFVRLTNMTAGYWNTTIKAYWAGINYTVFNASYLILPTPLKNNVQIIICNLTALYVGIKDLDGLAVNNASIFLQPNSNPALIYSAFSNPTGNATFLGVFNDTWMLTINFTAGLNNYSFNVYRDEQSGYKYASFCNLQFLDTKFDNGAD